MADEGRIKICCPSMEEAVNEEIVYLAADGEIILSITPGLKLAKYCPWCGELICKVEKKPDGG